MKLKNFFLTSFLAISFAFSATAHENAKGPHGGQLIDIAPYHAEFQVMTGMLHIYVLGEKDKPIAPKEVEGSIVIQFPDGKKTKEKLKAMGDALMTSATVSNDKDFVAIASLKIKGKAYTARYSHKAKKEGTKGESHD